MHRLALTALMVVILVSRVAFAIGFAPAVLNDAQGYETAAYRLVSVGSFAYPAWWERVWQVDTATKSAVITDEGRQAFLASSPNAYTMPGYSAMLAVIRLCTGGGESWRTWCRVVQALLSVGAAWLTYLLGRRFSERAGLIALALYAVYPPLIVANSYLLTEVVFMTLVLATVYLCLRWTDRRTWQSAVLAGAALGLSTWIRADIILWMAVVIVLALVGLRGTMRHVPRQLGVMALVAVMIVAPWWVRNYALYHHFVPFSTESALAAIDGIRIDAASQRPFPWQAVAPAQSPVQREIQLAANGRMGVEYPPRSEWNNDFTHGKLDAERFSRLRAWLVREHAWDALASRARSVATATTRPYTIQYAVPEQFTFGGLLWPFSWVLHVTLIAALAVASLVFWRRLDAALIVSVFWYKTAVHAVVIPLERYTFPLMPIAIVMGAVLLDWMIRRVAGQSASRTPSGFSA